VSHGSFLASGGQDKKKKLEERRPESHRIGTQWQYSLPTRSLAGSVGTMPIGNQGGCYG
jgi:hypothetical protein